jgi:hypothetical protein
MFGSVELIVVACLIAAPQECREHRVRLAMQDGEAAHCVRASPPRLAQWSETHPAWRVKSWRCATAADGETI